jgi:hypothetical protein
MKRHASQSSRGSSRALDSRNGKGDGMSNTQNPRRPWPLFALAAAAFVVVLLFGLDRTRSQLAEAPSESEVYSAASDVFEPMAATTHQSGKLEPPGIPKPLRLFAVRPGTSSREGVATLGAAEESSRTYVAGALLANGARLVELFPDRVVIVKGASKYTLYLQQKQGSDQLVADTKGLTVGDFPPPQPPLSPPAVRVSDVVRIAPVYEDTQITGYTLYAGSRSGQFGRWGLKEGDVLLSLGGQTLTSSELAESLLDQLAEGATLTGEVRRGQERITVTLNGGELTAAARPEVPPPMP